MTPSDRSARSELTQAPGSWRQADRNQWLPITICYFLIQKLPVSTQWSKGKCKPPAPAKSGIWTTQVTATRSNRRKRAGNNQWRQLDTVSTGNDAPPNLSFYLLQTHHGSCVNPQVSGSNTWEKWSWVAQGNRVGAWRPDLLLYVPVQSLLHTTLPLLLWLLGLGLEWGNLISHKRKPPHSALWEAGVWLEFQLCRTVLAISWSWCLWLHCSPSLCQTSWHFTAPRLRDSCLFLSWVWMCFVVFLFYWSRVDWQCFRCTAKWFSYIYYI